MKNDFRPRFEEPGVSRGEKELNEWEKLKLKMAPFKSDDRWKLLDSLKAYQQV
jgi:hypothetical protein